MQSKQSTNRKPQGFTNPHPLDCHVGHTLLAMTQKDSPHDYASLRVRRPAASVARGAATNPQTGATALPFLLSSLSATRHCECAVRHAIEAIHRPVRQHSLSSYHPSRATSFVARVKGSPATKTHHTLTRSLDLAYGSADAQSDDIKKRATFL